MRCIFDVNNNSFDIDNENIASNYIQINIGFVDNKKMPVFFNNLRYGFKLFNNQNIITDFSYPLQDMVLLSTDQEYINNVLVNGLFPDINYLLNIWVENNGVLLETSIDIILQRPSQPYSSWIYDDQNYMWTAPIPYPNDGNNYMWDETNGLWNLVNI